MTHNQLERNRTRANMQSGGQRAPARAPAQQRNAAPWFQRGYQPSPGIQGAINRGDYTNAYGASRGSIGSAFAMWNAAQGGPVNMAGNGREPGGERFYSSGFQQSDGEGGFEPLVNTSPDRSEAEIAAMLRRRRDAGPLPSTADPNFIQLMNEWNARVGGG